MMKRFRKICLIVCFTVLCAMLSAAVAACASDTNTNIYYLSLESTSWQTYNSKNSVPENLLFTKDGDLYTLEIDLEEGEQFTVNRVNSSEKYGFSALFSALGKLVSGDNGSIKVSESGTYALSLSVSDGTLSYSFTAKEEEVTLISISVTYSVAQMYVDDTYTFVATAYYSNNTSSTTENIIWSSDDETVATVSSNGAVTALSAGTATIKAEYGSSSDSVVITVIKPTVSVSGVTLDKTEIALEKNATQQLTPTVLPANADNQTVFWSSSNTAVATVSSDGIVSAVGYGTAKITVTTANGGYMAVCEVTVVQHVTAIKLSATELTVVAESSSKSISVSFLPAGATYTTFDYEVTKGESYISVTYADGMLYVSGLAEGEAEITITSVDNSAATATCTVTVYAKDTKFVNLPQSQQIMLEESAKFTLSFDNIDESDIESVSWSTLYEEVATVEADSDGMSATVTGVTFGSTVIAAVVTDNDRNTYTATCNILVADEFYFIYGYGLGAYDWDYQDYISDQNAASDAQLLLEEVSTGVYALTRHLTSSQGFQIIFPNVASFTDEDGSWNMDIKYPYTYYDSSRSDIAFITNATDYFRVNTSGVYTIYLDLTGSSAKVYIKNVSIDVTGVSLSVKEGTVILNSENRTSVVLSIEYSPESATFTEEDFIIWYYSQFANYANVIKITYDFKSLTITVTVTSNPTENFTLTVYCYLIGTEASIDLAVFSDGGEGTPIEEIAFDEEAYYVNVNNGTGDWTYTVHAAVNQDATIQQVKYYIDSSVYNGVTYYTSTHKENRYTVDTDTGLVTGYLLGTVTVYAYAVGDESFVASCTVTFYSDTIYLAGEFNDIGSFDALDQSVTSVDGTVYEDYKFTMVSYTYFTLEVQLAQSHNISYTTSSGVASQREQYGFQIVHLGMDVTWTSAIMSSFLNKNGSYNYTTYFDTTNPPNLRALVAGTYIIEIDLSGILPVWTINLKDCGIQDISLAVTGEQSSLNNGESAEIALSLLPSFVDVPASSDISWSVDKEDYVTINFDYDTMTCVVSITRVEFSEDITITVTCKVGDDITASVDFTLIAEHHLEWACDTTSHWYVCTDEGCNYTSTPETHQQSESYTCDANGHWYQCEICGGNHVDYAAHFTLTDKGWYEGDGICSVCGFSLFDMDENGTLTAYYGEIEKLVIPSSINNTTVTGLGRALFQNNTYLKEVVIPDGIAFASTIVPYYIFDGCTNLKSVTLSTAMTYIASYMFRNCTSLESITLHEGITTIYSGAFYGCSALTEIAIPNSVASIGSSAFAYISANIVWGDNLSVKTLDGCFYHYLGTSVDIPSTVRTIGATTFAYSNITNIVIPDTVTNMGSSQFRGCTSLVYAVIGSGVSHLENWDFYDCTALEYVVFKSTKFWGWYATCFTGCTSLKAVFYATKTSLLQNGTNCNYLLKGDEELLKGLCYLYYESDPGSNANYGLWDGYFAGTWYYDSDGNVVIWENGEKYIIVS